MNQLVSILMPAYNSEKWIAASIQSALDQSYDNTELIIVDDGSTDKTLEIAKSYSGPAVKVETQRNSGASAARNRALSLAQGDYIQWLDADDVLAPHKIRLQMERIASAGDDRVLYSGPWGKFYVCPYRARYTPTSLWQDLSPAEWMYRKFNENLYMAPECWLVSRQLTDLAGPWDESLFRDNDGDYFARVIANTRYIEFVRDSVSLHRIGVLGISHDLTINDRKLTSLARALENIVLIAIELEDSPRMREACLRDLEGWAFYFHPEREELLNNLERLAERLGGRLRKPTLPRKYNWLRAFVGFRTAKTIQRLMPAIRSYMAKCGEELLCSLDGVGNSDTNRVPRRHGRELRRRRLEDQDRHGHRARV